MIRITAGKLKGRRLAVAPGVRPTAERARQAAFDLLGPAGCAGRVLDAAAGSGALGLEALSRGAREAVFVEADPRVAAVLRENVARVGVSDRATIVVARVERFLSTPGKGPPFDLVFYDPPYNDDEVDGDLPGLWSLLAPRGTLVLETGPRAPEWPGAPPLADDRRYGQTRFLIWRRVDHTSTRGVN